MKKLLSLVLLAALVCALAGCSPSPTALTVSGRKVDASEYAFYLTYARRLAGESGPFTDAQLEEARQDALARITTQEVVRQKCKELGLSLSDAEQTALKDEKQAAIASLGGSSAYLAYLTGYAMTDRLYDKLRENALYYELLRQHVIQELHQEQYQEQSLRRFFGEHYILVKYIRLSLLDDDGQPLASDLAADQRRLANQIQAGLAQGASFDEQMAEYNDDPQMTAQPTGLVVSDLELEGRSWLAAAFKLKNGGVSDTIQTGDGLYILKRIELSASYFEYNRDMILERAQDHSFTTQLAAWESEAVVKTRKVIEKIDLSNYMEYVK